MPGSTDIKLLASIDGRSSWLTWNGSTWVAPTSATTRTDATSITDFTTNIGSLPINNKKLDIRVFLYSSVNTSTPSVLNINITSDAGYETSGVMETNIYDSSTFDLDWSDVSFSLFTPSGSSIIVKTRASNILTSMGSYGSALADGNDAGVVGQFIQFEVTFTSNGTVRPSIDNLGVFYVTPTVQDVAP